MGRSIMDAYLGARPPSETEVNMMRAGQQQVANMFGPGYVPMQAATVYDNSELLEGFVQGALDSGMVMDQLTVIRYTDENIVELSRRSTTIMASMPAAKYSALLEYKIRSNNVTDEEIRGYSHCHTGIDYGPNHSFSVHVDTEKVELPTEEELLNIAYNNQLLNLLIENELDE